MKKIKYYSTNNKLEKADFQTALLNGIASNNGLYMIDKNDIPKFTKEKIKSFQNMAYCQIAFEVLYPYLANEIEKDKLKEILFDAYSKDISPIIQYVDNGKINIMWLTKGPTYSFKDYAARFFGRVLNYFLEKQKQKKIVVVATSGDTGGAVADALFGLNNISNFVFFPKDGISQNQRRQMTTLKNNIYAFQIDGNFDICQTMVKRILNDKDFAKRVFNDENIFTTANSINIARILPQIVFGFFAYSRVAKNNEEMIASIPCGNFADMMAVVIAKNMGLPLSKIICGVNENRVFSEFLKTNKYKVQPLKICPSSAMNIAHPSNFARLIDIYGGHIYGETIDKMPDMDLMKKDLFSVSVSNQDHYNTIKDIYDKYKVILEPHGAVSLKAAQIYLNYNNSTSDKKNNCVIWETADPGKFPECILKAIKIKPEIPKNIIKQQAKKERIYNINSNPDIENGIKKLSNAQYNEFLSIAKGIFD